MVAYFTSVKTETYYALGLMILLILNPDEKKEGWTVVTTLSIKMFTVPETTGAIQSGLIEMFGEQLLPNVVNSTHRSYPQSDLRTSTSIMHICPSWWDVGNSTVACKVASMLYVLGSIGEPA